MTPFQSACVVIFGILAYLMWVDENVAVYLTLIFKVIRINTERIALDDKTSSKKSYYKLDDEMEV